VLVITPPERALPLKEPRREAPPSRRTQQYERHCVGIMCGSRFGAADIPIHGLGPRPVPQLLLNIVTMCKTVIIIRVVLYDKDVYHTCKKKLLQSSTDTV
jgi:hypothetical protein